MQASRPTEGDQENYWLPAPNPTEYVGKFVLMFRLYWAGEGTDPYKYFPPAVHKVAGGDANKEH